MSDLGDAKDIPALLALLAPGFIILWFRTRVLEGATPEFKQQLFYFAVVSAAYYGLLGPLFHISRGLQLEDWLWRLLFYFVLPVLIGLVVGWVTQYEIEYSIADKLGMHFSHRVPTAWDFRFSRVPAGTFLLVTLKDGTTVAGKMAQGSFASSAKDGRDIYMHEIWDAPETGEWTPIDPRRGMLLCGGDIRYVEFFGG